MNMFEARHPLLLVYYYVLMLSMLVYSQHPVIVMMSFIGAITYYALLTTAAHTIKELLFYSGVFSLTSLTYISFVHNGATPLLFLNDQPITLQSVTHGLTIGGIVVTIAFWTKCYFEIISTHTILFLCTKLSTKLGIFIAMVCRFIPFAKQQWQQKQFAQRAIGYYDSDSRVEKMWRYSKLLLHSVSYSAQLIFFKPNVMRARAYGYTKKRTQFQLITWQRTDIYFIVFFIVCTVCISVSLQAYRYYFYPLAKTLDLSILHSSIMFIYMLLPTLYELKERLKWHYLHSKI